MSKIIIIFVTTKTNSIIHGNFKNQTKIFFLIHSKNALKTVLARSGAKKNSFFSFDGQRVHDGRRVYDGRHVYGRHNKFRQLLSIFEITKF